SREGAGLENAGRDNRTVRRSRRNRPWLICTGRKRMNASYSIHPDMRELIAAKELLARTTDPAVLRAEWNNYGAKLSRPYPDGMVVKDEAFACPGAGRDGTVQVRIYRPAAARSGASCVIFIHGGGFI